MKAKTLTSWPSRYSSTRTAGAGVAVDSLLHARRQMARMAFVATVAHSHAFAAPSSRRPLRPGVSGPRRRGRAPPRAVSKTHDSRRGDTIFGHQRLGIGLGAFDLRCGTRRPHNSKPMRAKQVGDARGQRRLRSHHRHVHVLRADRFQQPGQVRRLDWQVRGNLCRSPHCPAPRERSVTPGHDRRRHAMACSRPPAPTTSIAHHCTSCHEREVPLRHASAAAYRGSGGRRRTVPTAPGSTCRRRSHDCSGPPARRRVGRVLGGVCVGMSSARKSVTSRLAPCSGSRPSPRQPTHGRDDLGVE